MDSIDTTTKRITTKLFDALPKPSSKAHYKKQRKMKQRIKKSVKKQTTELFERMAPDEIIEKLISEITKKHVDFSVKEKGDEESNSNIERERTYHSDIDVYVTDSSDSESSPMASEKKTEDSNTFVPMDDIEKSDKEQTEMIYKEKEISCLKEVNQKLNSALSQERRNRKLERSQLYMKLSNHGLLENRSRQLSKYKFDNIFKIRTVDMVDASNFSTFFGYIDRVLIETTVQCIALKDDLIETMNIYRVTKRHTLHKLVSSDGEIILLKQVNQNLKMKPDVQHMLLVKEAKLLTYLGFHKNLVFCHGITWVSNIPCLLTTYETNENLARIIQRNNKLRNITVKHLLCNIFEALIYMFSKGVIHNQLTTANFCVKFNGEFYDAVLVGFSHAIRASCSRCFTPMQQDLFKECNHLPATVISGFAAPSYQSEMFSLKLLTFQLYSKLCDSAWKNDLKHLLDKLRDNSSVLESIIDNIKML